MILCGSLFIDIDKCLSNEELETLTERLLDQLLCVLECIQLISKLLNVSSQIMRAHVVLRELINLLLVFFRYVGVSLQQVG
jgi:hypothetical protein